MPIAREHLLTLWNLEDIPACDEGMELARHFSTSAVIASRNALIRAHKDLVAHRAACPNCNEVDEAPDV